MGRRAGVTAEQTRSTLLSAAADIFAAKGYDGASISDICTAASLTSGALYTHYSSKAELFVAVLEAHGQRQFQDLVSGAGDVASFLATAGAAYGRRQTDSSLMIEAIVASKRHPEVAQLVASWLDADEDLLAASIREAQQSGALAEGLEPEAISRLATMISLGSILIFELEVRNLDSEAWANLIDQLVDIVRVTRPGE